MKETESRYATYLLRCWAETGPPDVGKVWRFSFENNQTGHRRGFSSFENLIRGLADELSIPPIDAQKKGDEIMSTTRTDESLNVAERDAFLEKVLASVSGVFDIFTIYLGHKLGLYQPLKTGEAMTSSLLAARTHTNERYVREWLEQQTVSGILRVENPDAGTYERRYYLPTSHAEVLTDIDSPNYVAPLALMLAGAVRPIEALLQAFRTGVGVPYAAYGGDFREGQGAINRVTFLQDLPAEWLPAIPELHQRLSSAEGARVADMGTGAGWSSIGIAQAYSNVSVDGFDLDEPSVHLARKNAEAAGLNGRVQFHVQDAADADLSGEYDLVTAFECIHDLPDPVAALRTMKRLATPDAVILVVDERVGDEFTPEGNDVEWMMYGWSVLHCLPVGMADQPSNGTGTVMRTATLRSFAVEAGFREVEVLPIENFFFRVYRLHQ